MERSAAHDDLLDAFPMPGCPVCRLTHRAVEHAMDSIDYEFVNDPGFRADVDAAWGFCPEHANQWLARARVLSTSLVYDGVLKEIEATLRQLEPSQRGGRMLERFARFTHASTASSDRECTLLKPDGQCPFCRVRDEAAAMAVTALIAGLSEPDFRAVYAQSATLCIPHLRQALCRAAPEEFAILRETAIAHVGRLRRQLREIIRKHDYRYRHEPAGTERGAAQRAVYHVAGWPSTAGHARQDQ
ncbi:MAG: hypothetical protein KatS3mg059_0578 [Thermomicrobiales bacterium]|nr:MAG: hypothetical protein KatS3mg059_0578 [Thermomicrobiales bacterium]